MKPLGVILVAVLAVSCSGGAESPTSATSGPSVLQLSQRQIGPYDGHEPVPTPAPTFNGTYSGSATRNGSTSFRITVTVAEAVITGALGTPPGAEVQASIPLSGSTSAAGAVTMTAIDDCGASLYTLTGSLAIDAAGVATMAGTYTEAGAPGCGPPRSGTWSAARTTATPPPAPPPASIFDGIYTGSATDGNDRVGGANLQLTLTVANGVAGFTLGSEGPLRGTLSGTGALEASGGNCNVTLTGQITITASGVATASGTWSHPAIICGESANSGSWTATR